MNDRLAIAAQLLANSPWVSAPSGKLSMLALKLADELIDLEQTTRPRPPEPKRWFPGVRRFFRFLTGWVYR